MQGSGLIVSNPEVMMGKPVIRGTQITVELLLEKLAAGQTEEQIHRTHPHITRVGIRAPVRGGSPTGVGCVSTGARGFGRVFVQIIPVCDFQYLRILDSRCGVSALRAAGHEVLFIAETSGLRRFHPPPTSRCYLAAVNQHGPALLDRFSVLAVRALRIGIWAPLVYHRERRDYTARQEPFRGSLRTAGPFAPRICSSPTQN
ncbi:MAG: DUF433 domain-containing protein [Bryobacterales bacterium]|nr:DUF433 domain-containing protein [Bryobacterales bacterium]